jgi:hypothetical protein
MGDVPTHFLLDPILEFHAVPLPLVLRSGYSALRAIAISLELRRRALLSRWTGIDAKKPLSRDQA